MTSPRDDPHPDSGGGDPYDALVQSCLDALESEGPEALEDVLEQHPEAAPDVRERLRQLHVAGLLDDRGEPEYPERLGEFRLIEPLGSGGMGIVFLAVQESLDREVALKLVRPERLYFPGARERFKREVEVVARLQHPGLVPVFTVGEQGGLPYFAMERVHGASLSAVLAELAGRRPERLTARDLAGALERASGESVQLGDRADTSWVESAVRLVLQVASTLAHTHGEGVLHRDVKPSNLMLALDLRVLLMDFGLASSEGTSSITGSGTVLGSMPYLPPEHLRGEEVSAVSDVYSLGVTLYELLALRLPFHERDPEALRQRILRGDAPAVRDWNAAVSWDLSTVCAKAMELDPERRYASAADFQRDLENLLALRPIEARRPAAWLRARRWTQRHPAAAVALLLITLVCLVAPLAYAGVQARANREIRSSWRRAESNLDLALQSIDAMLTHVGDAELAELPLLQSVRLEMVEEGERLLAELLAQRPDSGELELQRARLTLARADALAALGRPAEGKEGLERCLTTLQGIAVLNPDDLDLGLRLLRGWSLLGNLRLALGEVEEAARAYQSGCALGDSLGERHPLSARAWIGSSLLHRNLARLRFDHGEHESAFASVRAATRAARRAPRSEESRDAERDLALARAIGFEADMLAELGDPDAARLHDETAQVLDEALERWPEEPRLLVRAIELDGNRAAFLGRLGRREEAGPLFERALARARRLVELFPDVVSHRVWLGRVQMNRAVHAAQGGDLATARERIDEAVSVLEELHAARPDVVEFSHTLAGALMNASAMNFFPGTVDLARAHVERSVEVAEAGLASDPDNLELFVTLGQALLSLANTQQHEGDYRGAETSIRAAAETPLAETDWFRMTGELWVDCANLATSDPSMEPQQREDLVELYLDEALGAFREAFAAGFRDASYLEGNPALAGLRERAEFLELLEEMRAEP